MKIKLFFILLVILTMFMFPFMFHGIWVRPQSNSGPPLIVLKSTNELSPTYKTRKVSLQGLLPLKPIDSHRGPISLDTYVIHGSVSGMNQADGSEYYYVLDIDGMLSKQMYQVLQVTLFVSYLFFILTVIQRFLKAR